MSQSKISKIECGNAAPTEPDVLAIAKALRLSASVAADLRRQARGLRLAWATHRDLLFTERSVQQQRYGDHEANCQRLDFFSIGIVPALLQTPAYAEWALRGARIWWPEDSLDEQLVIRMKRQALLYDQSRQYRFLMNASTLRTVYGSEEILRSQTGFIYDMALRPNVEIAFLSEDQPQPRVVTSVFGVFDRKYAIVEVPTGDIVFREQEDVTAYSDLFEALWAVAVDVTTTDQIRPISPL